MKDERTPEQRYAAWIKAVNVCHAKGWQCVSDWIFQSPDGKKYNLSGIDLEKLDLLKPIDHVCRFTN